MKQKLDFKLFLKSWVAAGVAAIFTMNEAHAQLVLPAVQLPVGYRSDSFRPNTTFPSIDALCRADPVYDPPTLAVSYYYVYNGYREVELLDGTTGWYCTYMLEPASGAGLPQLGPRDRADVHQVYVFSCEVPMQLAGPSCILWPKKTGHSCPTPSTPHPIDIGNGNKFLQESIYRGNGSFPLVFSLHYNSNALNDSLLSSHSFTRSVSEPSKFSQNYPVFDSNWTLNAVILPVPGIGWLHSYQRNVSRVRGSSYLMLTRPDGKISTFGAPDPTERGTMASTISASGSTAWEYHAENGEIEYYDQNGLLASIVNPAGLRQTLAYDRSGHVTSVTDSFGRSLQMTYDTLGRPGSLTDPAGGIYHFNYAGKLLVNIEYPDHRSRAFLYENAAYPAALTGIVDENGKRYITYEYDASGRGILEYMAGGVEKYQVSYASDDGSSTVIDPLGTARTTNFQKINGVAFVANQTQPGGAGCSASTRYANYDANGNRTYESDFNGAVTTYTYDASRNLELTRSVTDGTSVYTTSTEWHSTLRLPVTIAEPKRITKFTYDNTGNMLTRSVQATLDRSGAQAFTMTTTGPARVWTYNYDGNGQIVKLAGPRADDVTTYTYSARGDISTVTDVLGHVTNLDGYDGNGRVGRITATNGLITTFSYSQRGWLTSKTALGLITSYEYDGVGQIVRITFPDGSRINYHYDDAHRLTDLSDSIGNSIHYTLDAMGNRVKEEIKDPTGTLSRQVSRQFDTLSRLQQATGDVQSVR